MLYKISWREVVRVYLAIVMPVRVVVIMVMVVAVRVVGVTPKS